jgi:hypothetical protein
MIGRVNKAGVLRIDEQCYGCGVLEILNGPERNEMGELWLEIGIDPETRQSKGGLYCPWRRSDIAPFSLNL